ncbi:MAG: hypothetical protein QM756_16865, partial [Polyangiaceae bacterium]
GVAAEDVRAIRERRLPAAERLAALSRWTRALIEKRGHVGSSELAEFLAVGFEPHQAFEVIAGLAVSVQANYAGNIARPVLEEAFSAQRWEG